MADFKLPTHTTDGRPLKAWDVMVTITASSYVVHDRYVLAETKEEAQALADAWVEEGDVWHMKTCPEHSDVEARVWETRAKDISPVYISSRIVGSPAIPEATEHEPAEVDCPHWGEEDRNDE